MEKYIWLISLGMAAVFLLLSYIMYQCKKKVLRTISERKMRCTVKETARLIDIKSERKRISDDYVDFNYPVYAFYVNGKEIHVQNNISINPKKMHIGQEVTLFYNPYYLREIYVPEEKAESSATIFSVMHICMFAAGIIMACLTPVIAFFI